VTDGAPDLSVVIPARDEAENLPALLDEMEQKLAGIRIEAIVVDDGSSDVTPELLGRLRERHPWLVALRHDEPLGQSAALASGFRTARGAAIATIDGDRQNDPGDLPALWAIVRGGDADLAQGFRADRRDPLLRRAAAAAARPVRRILLGDTTRDIGCATRVMTAELARRLPLDFRGMHRFLPILARMQGARVVERPVTHRPRPAGRSNYGILDRGVSGFFDCLAVRWMLRRHRPPGARPIP
jgi:dolichol-phosphate mannosyltransferase